jgi:hypothetical protein
MTEDTTDMTAPTASPTGERLSWRDMMRALERTEDKIILSFKAEMTPLIQGNLDHEGRLRTLESTGSQEARDALAKAQEIMEAHLKLVDRVKSIEDANKAKSDQRSGQLSVLTGAQKVLIIIISIVTFGTAVTQLIETFH